MSSTQELDATGLSFQGFLNTAVANHGKDVLTVATGPRAEELAGILTASLSAGDMRAAERHYTEIQVEGMTAEKCVEIANRDEPSLVSGLALARVIREGLMPQYRADDGRFEARLVDTGSSYRLEARFVPHGGLGGSTSADPLRAFRRPGRRL